jgi:hypothetical protein
MRQKHIRKNKHQWEHLVKENKLSNKLLELRTLTEWSMNSKMQGKIYFILVRKQFGARKMTEDPIGRPFGIGYNAS